MRNLSPTIHWKGLQQNRPQFRTWPLDTTAPPPPPPVTQLTPVLEGQDPAHRNSKVCIYSLHQSRQPNMDGGKEGQSQTEKGQIFVHKKGRQKQKFNSQDVFCIWQNIHPSAIAILVTAALQERLQMFSKGNFDKLHSQRTVWITSMVGTTRYER